MFCDISWHPIYLIFTSEAPRLLYYTHIPATIISLFFGFLVYKNSKTLISKILLTISVLFSLWSILNLIVWVNDIPLIISFVWSFFGIIIALLFLACIYFTEVYITKKDVGIKTKIVWLMLLSPLIIFINQAVTEFNVVNCEVVINHNYDNYGYIVGLISFIWILIFSITKYFKSKELVERKQIILLVSGISAFLISFFVTGFWASYWDNFELEQYGLFGMVIFMAYLAFLIVRFKAFDIKLLGAQALVWALVITIGSEFLFVTTLTNQILVGVTLVISSILGLSLVRSVKKEVTLREHLEIANGGQKNLIHIMNHQIKGYLSTNKNIFAELLTDDYGKVPEEATDLIKKGLESSDNGQKYVSDILRGASAENGTLVYDMQPMDFKDLVSEVVLKEKEVADKKGLKFEVNIADGDYNMVGDCCHLREAIRNLVDNSIYYTPQGGIFINLKRKANSVIFSVKDTGIGIKEEDKTKLFKSGGVGSDSLKINVNSSGYGLAFVKGIIDQHKGKVWFESAGSGKGSTFYVELLVR